LLLEESLTQKFSRSGDFANNALPASNIINKQNRNISCSLSFSPKEYYGVGSLKFSAALSSTRCASYSKNQRGGSSEP